MKNLQLLIFLFGIGFSYQKFSGTRRQGKQGRQGRQCTPFKAVQPSISDLKKVADALQRLPDLDEQVRADYRNYTFPTAAITKDAATAAIGATNVESYLKIGDVIKKNGYKYEEHEVTTSDGYILTIQRVKGKGKPVLIWHGTQGSASDSVIRGEDSIAFILNDAGYDVWLSNNRGNQYSRKHQRISPQCAEFWDFSWDEIGMYDAPAVIDHVLDETGSDKLHYIGYSGGCTTFFIMGALRPEYNAKIYSFVGLSPAVWLGNTPSPPWRVMAKNSTIETIMLNALGKYEITNNFQLDATLTEYVCGHNVIGYTLCSRFIFPLVGFKPETLDFVNVFPFANHFYSGVSDKQIRYYNQRVRNGNFVRYDYGDPMKNRAKYGTDTPPGYDLSNMTEKITLYRGDNDWVSQRNDIQKLVDSLPDGNVFVHSIEDNTHVDWVLGTNSRGVYDEIVRGFNEFGYN